MISVRLTFDNEAAGRPQESRRNCGVRLDYSLRFWAAIGGAGILLALSSGPGEGKVPVSAGFRSPERFTCTIRSASRSGSSIELLGSWMGKSRTIRRDRGRYRVDYYPTLATRGKPLVSTIRPSKVESVEWKYYPATGRAVPSPEYQAHYIRILDPSVARKLHGESRPAGLPKPPELQTQPETRLVDRKANPSVKLIGQAKRVTVGGKLCKEFKLSSRPMLDHPSLGPGHALRFEPGVTQETSIAIHGNIVMRQVTRTHRPESASGPKWIETRMEVASLDLTPSFPPDAFELPRTATLVLFDRLPVKAPAGYKVERRKGWGILPGGTGAVVQ